MDNSIDQQFVEFVVKSLVNQPDAVKVDRRVDEKGVLLELTVDPEDLGRVIGKRGATAQSLRTLLRALGTKNDARYNLKIVDNGEGPAPKPISSNDDDSQVDDMTVDEPTSQPADEPAQAEEAESEPMADEPSDLASKTREELKDLDDLDV
jgi:uncharacterized protein